MRPAIVASACSLALFAAACGGGASKSPTPAPTGPAATATAPAPAPTLAPDDAPLPEHVTFSPGETISADGEAGVFFLDPKTGAAEAWLVPAAHVGQSGYLPFTFTPVSVSADGSRLLYTCKDYDASGQLAPCGGAAHNVWYLFDTRSGERTRLSAFEPLALSPDLFTPVSISPDGRTVVAATRSALFVAPADDPGALRRIDIPEDPMYTQAIVVGWSPDSSIVIVRVMPPGIPGGRSFAIAIAAGDVNQVADGSVAWAPDGAHFAVASGFSDDSELVMYARNGGVLWSKPAHAPGGGPAWSADGKYLYVFQRDAVPTAADPNPPDRADVLDPQTGETLVRARGVLCPEGWVGSTHRFVTGTYGAGEVVVDVDAATYKALPSYAHAAPFDDETVYAFDGADFRAVDIATGATRLIAHTTVFPAWDPAHPMYAGDRIFFTPLHGGHGGCGEGSGPAVIPKVEVQRGPFGDAPDSRPGR